MSNEQEKIAENEDLVPRIKATSVIWNYFSYKTDDIDQTRVMCLVSVATTRGSTTNLFDHLCQYHIDKYHECKARSDCHPKQQQQKKNRFQLMNKRLNNMFITHC